MILVIACGKRYAFVQGSVNDEAIRSCRLDCFADARNDNRIAG
jgi:hypothetical protein